METRQLEIDGTVYTVPKGWSDPASRIFAMKYCREFKDKFKETDFKEVFVRLVNFWGLEGLDYLLIDDLWSQRASPNSPQYFNAGIYKAYVVHGNDIGLYSFDESGFIRQCDTTYVYPQLHACFIQPIEDSLKGIMDLLDSESRLFSRGSGTGTNFSSLRGTGEPMSSGGTSSGLISFLRIFDVSAGAIKSGGTTRRAAKMVVLDVDHPDVLKFIDWKVREEQKAQALIKAGFDGHWEGEAYQSVSGQNSNNSIRIPDAFMDKLEANAEWDLNNRSGEGGWSVPARRIWAKLCHAAWQCADPGVQFSDTINSWNTTPRSGEIRASNPCSEHLRLDNSACNLASLNLLKFMRENGEFDTDMFTRTVRRWVRVLDRSVDLAGYPTAAIAKGAYKFRDIGLGFCGLGAMLMRRGIPYDSAEGRALATLIAALMNAVAYDESVMLAKERGAYPEFYKNRKEHLGVLERHHGALPKVLDSLSGELKYIRKQEVAELFESANTFYDLATVGLIEDGIRNAQLTVIAPTGTIGLTMECETTGIEPVYDKMTVKTLAGGGALVTSSDSFAIAQKKLGIEVGVLPPDKQKKALANPVFATAVDDTHGNYLSPMAHVDMVAAVQPHISGGISKTVNLPKNATSSDISMIYEKAYKAGVKCISVYRDGCKSQPLTADCKKCGDEEACDL